MRKKKNKKSFPWVGFEPTITVFGRQYAITSTMEAIDTWSPHQRTIYLHKDISTAIYAICGSLWLLGLGGFFTHLGILAYCIEKPEVGWGPGEIAILLLAL